MWIFIIGSQTTISLNCVCFHIKRQSSNLQQIFKRYLPIHCWSIVRTQRALPCIVQSIYSLNYLKDICDCIDIYVDYWYRCSFRHELKLKLPASFTKYFITIFYKTTATILQNIHPVACRCRSTWSSFNEQYKLIYRLDGHQKITKL